MSPALRRCLVAMVRIATPDAARQPWPRRSFAIRGSWMDLKSIHLPELRLAFACEICEALAAQASAHFAGGRLAPGVGALERCAQLEREALGRRARVWRLVLAIALDWVEEEEEGERKRVGAGPGERTNPAPTLAAPRQALACRRTTRKTR